MIPMPEWITKYWIEWVFGLLIAALGYVVKTLSGRVKRQTAEYDALRNGMRSLLRSQIVDSCERAMKDGYCGTRLRDTINDLYDSYHALGGNGTVTSLVQQTMGLPAIQSEKGEHHD